MRVVCYCGVLQDGQEFLKLLLSKLEVVFGASQQQVSTWSFQLATCRHFLGIVPCWCLQAFIIMGTTHIHAALNVSHICAVYRQS